MTREMNKPEWLMTKHYCLICRPNTRDWCSNCLFNPIFKRRVLDEDWKPFIERLNANVEGK